MIYTRIIFTWLLCLAMAQVSAQRVGLVLSGGGAKGLYHIGVIRALEENGIPIDCISGTSMGAIIAGLYAIGYSPEEMAELFSSEKVSYWMSGKIEKEYVYYFRQRPPSASMVTLQMDIHRKKLNRSPRLHLPTNLIPSSQIDMAFVEFFSGPTALSGGNFDNLFVPFRCVASDGLARKERVYRTGNLGMAIRASMTIPFVFKPLQQDSTLLYDGGIYNNFPWQVLQQDFNPDVLIGSKCILDRNKSQEYGLIDQINLLLMNDTDFVLPSEKDILIEHIFDDVSMLDFSKAEYTINRGYRDAIEMMPLIKERILRRVACEDLKDRREEYREQLPLLEFDDYKVSGLNAQQSNYVDQLLGFSEHRRNNSVYTYDEFCSEYFKMLSEGEIVSEFPEVNYRDSTGRFSIDLHLKTKPQFKVMIGGNISSTSMNQAYSGLEYRGILRHAYTYNLDGYFSALYSSVQLRGRIDYFFKRPVALLYGLNYNYYNFFRSDFGTLNSSNDLFKAKHDDTYASLGLSFPMTRATQLTWRVHLGREDFNYYPAAIYSSFDRMDRGRFQFASTQVEFDRSALNYLIYPTRGIKQSISLIAVQGNEEYRPGTLSYRDPSYQQSHFWAGARFFRETYYQATGWFSWGYTVDGVLTNHPQFKNHHASLATLPSFLPTNHSHTVFLQKFRSPAYLGMGITPIFEFNPRFYLKSTAYLYLPYDIRQKGGPGPDQTIEMILNSSLIFQTPVGPAGLTLSKYGVRDNANWFLTFNFGFTIFNRSGLFY